ncbi:hypothetical protein UCREL1_9440 [Eutypa lata UCREL1]|uniref:Trafficking protein particle complex II-specific subunit 65 IgD3 domain-containing protein n=1 Tax=Eutypa lata (strain UCR-EL1) TaxID=1287681 RepID=M7TAD9_EUTLA|nr:hypothetical protein UCREL1_9440 [Eutypa lata UCREL1]
MFNFKLQDEFDEGNGNSHKDKSYEDIFKSIERRESLFFDESVDVYLVLRTAHVQDNILKSYLRRLVITLETQITSGNAPENDHPPTNSEVIYSGTVDESEDPVILSEKAAADQNDRDDDSDDDDDDEEDEEDRYIYAVWKLSVFLGRPRMRLQTPSAIFTTTASLKPAAADHLLSSSTCSLRDTSNGSNDYLPSGMPFGLNLLEAFGSDPAMNGIKPRLSALRVSRVAPVTQQAKDMLRPIRVLPKQLTLGIYPAMHSRIRFSRPHSTAVMPNSNGGAAVIIAMLEIDFTPFFECEILLRSIDVSVRGDDGGSVVVDDLTGGAGGLSLPLSCVAHDHVTFLYRIAPAASALEDNMISKYPSRELSISIGATALAEPGICEPTLRMAWGATVDFTLPLNPGYGTVLQPIQRSHRPSQLSIGGGADTAASLTAPAVSRPDSIPSLEAATSRTNNNNNAGVSTNSTSRETSFSELGITVTISAPPASQKIYPGDAFAWSVFVVNRAPLPPNASATAAGGALTPTAPPRKLALMAIPRRRRHDARVNRPPSVSSSSQVPFPTTSVTNGGGGGGGGHYYDRRASLLQQHPTQPQYQQRDRTIADAVLDDAVVHAMQRGSSALDDAAPLASLSADVRVGPLAPGACHAAELRFLALRAGVHAVEVVRVVDLGSNEHVDIKELPTILVESR